MSDFPLVAITSGEPAGVGPEVTLKALQRNLDARIVVLGDLDWLNTVNQTAGLGLKLFSLDSIDSCPPHQPGQIAVFSIKHNRSPILGQLDQVNAPYVLQLLEQAHEWAHHQKIDAIVTAPVHKGVLNSSQFKFTGHTEFFAEKSNMPQVVMMLASDAMNVALATTHLPLAEVANTIKQPLLEKVIRICIDGLQRMGLPHPDIKVLGLNPHAGEQGHLGKEDTLVISPAIKTFRSSSARVTGPYPADTAFSKLNLPDTDLFLAMYHDQGLPVIKYASFGQCANVTLGLPYIRTSVDHGTALDIAPQFCASATSMQYAIEYAIRAARRGKQPNKNQ